MAAEQRAERRRLQKMLRESRRGGRTPRTYRMAFKGFIVWDDLWGSPGSWRRG